MQGPLADYHGQRNTGFCSRITASRSPDHCPLPTRFARRLPVRGARITASRSRLADHGSRITAGDLRAGMFGTKSAGQGAASLTLLMAQCWPASGHKKTRRYVTTGGRVVGLCGAYTAIQYPLSGLHRTKLLLWRLSNHPNGFHRPALPATVH